MSKHTPGPWTSSGTQVCTWDKNNYVNNVPFTYDPPLPGASRQWTEKLLEEAKANAHLIAAAPEMLEALEKIFAELEKDARRLANSNRRGDQSVGYTLGACRQWAHEAIAKAKGGAR